MHESQEQRDPFYDRLRYSPCNICSWLVIWTNKIAFIFSLMASNGRGIACKIATGRTLCISSSRISFLVNPFINGTIMYWMKFDGLRLKNYWMKSKFIPNVHDIHKQPTFTWSLEPRHDGHSKNEKLYILI